MKTILKAAILAATIAPAAIASAQTGSGTVLTVDVQRVYAECNACKTANTTLQSQLQQLQALSTQLGQPLRTEADALQKQLAGKTPDTADAATKARIQAFQTREQQANQTLQQRQQALQATAANVRRQINEKLGPIVNSVLTAHKGASVVVDENSTLASAPGSDVTNEVLAQLNTQLTTISVTPPAAAAAAPAAAGNVGR